MPQAVTAVATAIYVAVGTTAAALGASSATAAALATAAVSAASAATQVAILAGLNAVVAHNNKPRPQGGLINLTISPNEPRRLQIGTRINGGVLADWYVQGTKNQRLFMIVYLGEGPMGQITKVYGGGREVYSTPINHGTRTAIPNYRSGGDRLWITYYDGRPGQTADSYLVSQGVGWSANHVGAGCAYAIIEALWDSDNQMTPPQLSFEIEGAKLYDRRKDTTAGGSGAHRATDPATWELSSNPAVALDHYLLGRYSGTVKTFGAGLAATDVPYAPFAARANLADENVNRKVYGTLKRYAANGFLFADRSYSDTIRDLCRAMNARPADFGGRIGIIDGEEKTPVMTLADADVIDGVPESYTPKRSWADLVSVVRGTYQNPAQLYQAGEYPRVTDAAWTAADGGSPKEATLDLEMETDVERAQRLATLFARRERRQAQLTGTYALRAIELEQGDWFIRAGGIFGAGKTFEVIDRVLDARSMTVTITAFEVDPADSAWVPSTAIDAPPAAVADTNALQAMAVPSLTVTGVTLSGTVADLPAIRVQWTAPDDPRVRQIVVEAVPTAGGVPVAQTVDVGTAQVVFTNGITDDTAYLVRARFIGEYIPSAWTGNVAVTTLGDYSVGVATSVPWAGVTGAGRPADNADVTAANTAAGIAGQGAFATVNTAGYGSALLTGFGTLAPLGFTTLGTNVRRADGATAVTDATAITALGTAAAIAGQGAFATVSSAAYGSALLTGFGGLSPLNFTTLGAGGLVRRQDGVTALTDDAAVTSLGTAAAIAGQGSFATLSSISDSLANSNNLLRRSAGGLFTGSLAATLGARAGTDIFRTDGATVLTQAEIRTPEGTAAAIAGQGWGATAAEAAASNLLRGNTANIIPDPDHRNPDFWNFPAGASGGDADNSWRGSRWIVLANGTYDFSSDYFPVETGVSYIIRTRIWNNAGAFSGSFWPLIHIPYVAWYSLKHGAGVNPDVADASNAIVAGGDTGELTWVIANPTGIFENANRQWQFRLKGSFTGGPVVMQVEIVRAARIGDSFVLANGQTLPAQNVLVTSEGTAAAIAGQAWAATNGSEAAASNAQVPVGQNRVWYPRGEAGTKAWGAFNPSSLSATIAQVAFAGRIGQKASITATAAGQVYVLQAGPAAPYRVPMAPGERLAVAFDLEADNVASGWCYVNFVDVSGAYLSTATAVSWTGNQGFVQSKLGFVTAPANAAGAYIDFYVTTAAAGLVQLAVVDFRVAAVSASQTVAPPFTPGREHDPLADVTLANTAAAITGQGVWATGNYYEQTSDPGSVPNGSFWFKTDTNEFYVRRSGAWGKVSDITPATSPLSGVTLSSYYVLGFTSGGVGYSGAVTATAIDGDGTYTYFWTRTSQAGAQRVTCSNTAIAGPTFSVAAGGSSGDSWTCTITETSTSRSFQATVAFDISLI